MEQILGPEVAGHPVWNLRTKTPNSRAVDIPWHQGEKSFGIVLKATAYCVDIYIISKVKTIILKIALTYVNMFQIVRISAMNLTTI